MQIPTGERIREARTARGLTQAELADKAGISQPLVARIESSDVDTTLETMHKVVAAINGSDPDVDENEVEIVVQSALKEARKNAGYTQGELATKASVSQPLISRIERHDVNPRVSTLRSLFEHVDPLSPDRSNEKSTPNKTRQESDLLSDIESEFDALKGGS